MAHKSASYLGYPGFLQNEATRLVHAFSAKERLHKKVLTNENHSYCENSERCSPSFWECSFDK